MMIKKISSYIRKADLFKKPEIFINLTYKCPLRCKFCYVDYNNKNEFTKNDMDELFLNGILQNDNIKLVTFFGGEPLLKIDLIEYVLEKYYDKCCEKNIHLAVITSMSINYNRYLNILQKYSMFETVISFDNFANERIYGNNKPFRVLEHIDLNNISKYNNNICFHLVMDNDKSLDDLLYVQQLYSEYGILYSWCWNKTPKHTFDFKEKYLKVMENIIKDGTYFPKQFTDELSFYYNKNNNGCGIGSEYYISSNGDISPCSISHHNNKFIIMKNGIINEDSFENIELSQNNIFDNEKCRICDIKGFCNGGCLIERLKYRNDINSVNPILCEIQHKLYETYDEFVSNLDNKTEQHLKNMIIDMDLGILGYCYDTSINIDMSEFKKEK